jgi:hypothetical protein
VTGGWYDAGDHGKYVVNAGTAVWTLQNLYEAGFARRVFADGRARLPEAGNGRDDLLDEARWEVEWMLRMQVPVGTRLALPVGAQDPSGKLALTTVEAGGMVHHKVADAQWTGLPTNPADERTWAAAELFATTGEPGYRAPLTTGPTAAPGWASVAPLGTITLATADGVPPAIRDAARAAIVAAFDGFLAEELHVGYRIPYAAQKYDWGSNGTILYCAMLLGLAARFTGDPRYRAGVVDAADYILGRNLLSQSFVSRMGSKPLLNPHHRFWAHQIAPNSPPPPPPLGALSGGPNNSAMADPIAMALKGHCAAALLGGRHPRLCAERGRDQLERATGVGRRLSRR